MQKNICKQHLSYLEMKAICVFLLNVVPSRKGIKRFWSSKLLNCVLLNERIPNSVSKDFSRKFNIECQNAFDNLYQNNESETNKYENN